MFKNQPLYDAKKNTLKLGIELINIRSKAMNEVLALMKKEVVELDSKVEENILGRVDNCSPPPTCRGLSAASRRS